MAKVTMTKQEMGEFLKEPWIAHVATLTKTGHPHSTPIWCYHDGTYFYISLIDGNAKTRALERDNRVALSITSEVLPYKAVLVHGTADLIRDDMLPIVKEIVAKYLGREQAENAPGMIAGHPQVVARITPKRIYTWDQSKGTFDDVAAAEKTGYDFRTL